MGCDVVRMFSTGWLGSTAGSPQTLQQQGLRSEDSASGPSHPATSSHGPTPLRNSPEINFQIDIGADRMNGSAAK